MQPHRDSRCADTLAQKHTLPRGSHRTLSSGVAHVTHTIGARICIWERQINPFLFVLAIRSDFLIRLIYLCSVFWDFARLFDSPTLKTLITPPLYYFYRHLLRTYTHRACPSHVIWFTWATYAPFISLTVPRSITPPRSCIQIHLCRWVRCPVSRPRVLRTVSGTHPMHMNIRANKTYAFLL